MGYSEELLVLNDDSRKLK